MPTVRIEIRATPTQNTRTYGDDSTPLTTTWHGAFRIQGLATDPWHPGWRKPGRAPPR